MGFDEFDGVICQAIGKKARKRHLAAILLNARVEIVVEVPSTESVELLESLSARIFRIMSPIMPFPEGRGCVSRVAKDLGECHLFTPHRLVTSRDAVNARAEMPAPR